MPRGVRTASMISASAMVMSPGDRLSVLRSLARRHADRTVEPHVLAVEVAVGDHGVGELRVLLRPAEAAREGDLRSERLLQVLRRPLQQWCVEDAGQDGVA